MDLGKIKEFLQRYANNTHTDEEHQQFIEWLRIATIPEVETIVEQYRQIAEDSRGQQIQRPELIAKIEAGLNELPKSKLVRLPKTLWFRAAAAAIFILLGTGIYLMVGREKQPKDIVAKETSAPKNDVLPGNSRAVLVLDNGTEVALEDQSSQVIKERNGQQINNTTGSIAYSTDGVSSDEVIYNTIKVPRKGQYMVKLSDGTKVWLNAESSLKYPTTFPGNERRVEITGEAYFEVTKNTEKPFHVIHDNMDVNVLGTHFNINSYSGEKEIRVTLLEGSVNVSSPFSANNGVVLKPGQQAQLKSVGNWSVLNNADIEEAIAWKEGRFQFKETDLKAIMRQLMRWYDVEVEYRGNVGDRFFTADIVRTKNLSAVLKILEMSDVHCVIEGNKLIVMP